MERQKELNSKFEPLLAWLSNEAKDTVSSGESVDYCFEMCLTRLR
jgi:hypothetical protein